MVVLPGSAVGQIVFGATKVWLLALPLLWMMLIDRKRPQIPKLRKDGMAMGAVTGIAIFFGILGSYWLVGRHWMDMSAMQARAFEIGLHSPAIYVGGAIYWCFINSLLEEYVWRWFVVTRCEALLPRVAAIIVSGVLFTIHHVVALQVYFDLTLTILTSLGVFIGGATWSWLYAKYRNIYAAWISHILADLAIFIIGYFVFFG